MKKSLRAQLGFVKNKGNQKRIATLSQNRQFVTQTSSSGKPKLTSLRHGRD